MFWKFIVFWLAFGAAMMILGALVITIFSIVMWISEKIERMKR